MPAMTYKRGCQRKVGTLYRGRIKDSTVNELFPAEQQKPRLDNTENTLYLSSRSRILDFDPAQRRLSQNSKLKTSTLLCKNRQHHSTVVYIKRPLGKSFASYLLLFAVQHLAIDEVFRLVERKARQLAVEANLSLPAVLPFHYPPSPAVLYHPFLSATTLPVTCCTGMHLSSERISGRKATQLALEADLSFPTISSLTCAPSLSTVLPYRLSSSPAVLPHRLSSITRPLPVIRHPQQRKGSLVGRNLSTKGEAANSSTATSRRNLKSKRIEHKGEHGKRMIVSCLAFLFQIVLRLSPTSPLASQP